MVVRTVQLMLDLRQPHLLRTPAGTGKLGEQTDSCFACLPQACVGLHPTDAAAYVWCIANAATPRGPSSPLPTYKTHTSLSFTLCLSWLGMCNSSAVRQYAQASSHIQV